MRSKLSTYFIIIGIVLFLIWLCGLIYFIINMVGTLSILKQNDPSKGMAIFGYVLGLITIVVFGPAFALLFISAGDLMDAFDMRLSNEKSNSNVTNCKSNNQIYVGNVLLLTADLTLEMNVVVQKGTKITITGINNNETKIE